MKIICKEKCTGCGACYNICPVNAIRMIENEYGFFYPEIDDIKCIGCQKCNKVCPKNNNNNTNWTRPLTYVAVAEKRLTDIESSGGAFGVLSEAIIEMKGVVFGATMDNHYNVYHCYADSIDNLEQLFGSKYVQSNTRRIYWDIKNFLDGGKMVLFCGCPCQVAAVRNYFEGKYEDQLLLVDLLCHGVPSLKMFKDYLYENINLSMAKDIKFRDKEYGWRADSFSVKYLDESKEHIPSPENAYLSGFLRNITLRDGCDDCVFSGNQRFGDVTIGDYWGVEKYDSEIDRRKGVSVILVNNEFGMKYVEKVKNNFIVFKPTSWDVVDQFNRVHTKYPFSNKRDRFLELYKSKTFTESVMQCVEDRYDVGLVGTYAYRNYGSQLVYWALYSVIRGLGYSVIMIERPNDSREKPREYFPYLFEKNPYDNYALSNKYMNIAEMKKLNRQCKLFVTGSDQIFNYNGYILYNKFMVQNFVTDNKFKIAYAASWAHSTIWGSESDRAEESYFLQKFDFFSVREKSAIKLCKEEFGLEDVECVLDPVLLLDKECYLELVNTKEDRNDFILLYLIKYNSFFIEKVKDYARKNNKDLMIAYDPNIEEDSEVSSVEQLIRLIANASMVITDSFHGMCLSIVFNKEFELFVNRKTGADRFESLLDILMIDSHIAYAVSKCIDNLNNDENINYKRINALLEIEKEKSLHWLSNALRRGMNIKRAVSQFDILDGRIDDLYAHSDIRIDNLTQEVQKLREELVQQKKGKRIVLFKKKGSPK